MRCCCFAWAISTSCSTTTPRRPSRVLGLTLTSRDKGENPIPMAGFPHHQLESYLAKLIAAGLRAAVCEQVEDPKQAKGLVKREVTRVVTPGTLTDDALLDPRESNYLAAVALPAHQKQRRLAGAASAWVELSTGRFLAATVPLARLADELARIGPAECLVAEDARARRTAPALAPRQAMLTRRPAWAFGLDTAPATLHKHFRTATLDGFGFDDGDSPCPARRRRAARLPARDAEDLARPHRPAHALSRRRAAGDRRGDPPQPGAHAHAPQRPPRRLAAGGASTGPSRRWARGCWPTGSPTR